MSILMLQSIKLKKTENLITQRIQFTLAINFMSSKSNDEDCVIHSKGDNIEIMTYDKTDKVIK